MNFHVGREHIEAVVPGVSDAYAALRNTGGMGIYTSTGAFYNHTIFGRDVGMSAKFVSDFDHDAVWETIKTLSVMQGMDYNPRTQEEFGRIHHEFRDYTTWNGRTFERFGMWWAGHIWGMKNKKLLTYFATDTTANYIRLVNKYAQNIDASITMRDVPDKRGGVMSVASSIERAADWIESHIDERGVLLSRRRNRWSLPYQTFQDSVTAYAWRDGSPVDTSRVHSFVETQAFALDALEDAARLLSGHEHAGKWRQAADRMQRALLNDFWDEEHQFFGSMLAEKDGHWQLVDVPNVAAGWTLNTSFWQHLSDTKHATKMVAIVKRLFSDDFLTDVGLRTRSIRTVEPLGEAIDYHGSQTVWPMFTFMVIEGLRRHKLYRLAEQLENRLLNGVNALGNFPEFMIVDHDGQLYRPDRSAKLSKQGQMVPEVNIAFTVVPMLTLARRRVTERAHQATGDWQEELEDELLYSIKIVEALPPEQAAGHFDPTPLRLRRTMVGLRSAWYIAPIMKRRPS